MGTALKTTLKFGDPDSIALVKEYERLVAVLETYTSMHLTKRRATYRKAAVKVIKCCLCPKAIDPGSLYYSASKRSAHDQCVDGAHDRKRELDPEMGARSKRLELVKK